MKLFKTKNTRGAKLGKILTQIASFIVAETYVGETEAQHQLSQAILAIEKAQTLCASTDDEIVEGPVMNIAITKLGQNYIGAICARMFRRHGPAVARSIVQMIEQSASPAPSLSVGDASANTSPAPSPAQARVSPNEVQA